MNKISGVYKITNTKTGDFYIGSSKDIKRRWLQHKRLSSWKHSLNSQLYQDMQKYGLDNFKFEIIEETDNLREREQYWIIQLNPSYNDRRAKGLDVERDVERRKEYRQSEKGKESRKKSSTKYCQSEKGKETLRRAAKKYGSQLCSYNGETLTLKALSNRFYRVGIKCYVQAAKKYLIGN